MDGMVEFLTFNDAVVITNQLIAFFNSPRSDDVILFLAQKFNLQVKADFTVHVTSINKNCPECSGTVCGNTILGCYETHMRNRPGALCYWDQALEKILGTKLIVHEVGHVIYDQIFNDGLSDSESYDQSEQFALYMENHFDLNMNYLVENNHTRISINPGLTFILESIVIGVAISAASLGIAHVLAKRRAVKT